MSLASRAVEQVLTDLESKLVALPGTEEALTALRVIRAVKCYHAWDRCRALVRAAIGDIEDPKIKRDIQRIVAP